MKTRIPSLDGLRAISIMMVLADHLAYALGWNNKTFDMFGHAGVVVFFVISGYLITTLIMKDGARFSAKAFYKRRALRILPAAFVYLAVITAFQHAQFSWRDIGLSWGYLSSYASLFGKYPWNLTHLWSLSVEEQFYLLWPLVFVFSNPKRLAWAAVVIAPVVRYFLGHAGYHAASYFMFPAVFDSIAVGCLLALYRAKPWRHGWILWLIAPWLPFMEDVGSIHGYFHIPQVLGHASWTLFNFTVAGGVAWAIQAQPRLLNNRAAVWVGMLSYGLYLWQMPFMNPSLGLAWPLRITATFLAAVASYYAIEQPALSLRGRVNFARANFKLKEIL